MRRRFPTKNKIESIAIRMKPLKDGAYSIFLDLFYQSQRRIEYLKMYLIKERTDDDRRMNEMTMRAVHEIRNQRLEEFYRTGDVNVVGRKTDKRMLMMDYMSVLSDRAKKSSSNGRTEKFRHLQSQLKQYDAEVQVRSVTVRWVNAFYSWLLGHTNERTGKPLSKSTIKGCLVDLEGVLDAAVKDGFIKKNPMAYIQREKIRGKTEKRCYLTIDEVKALMDAPCSDGMVKSAFLVSCFSGMRYSDLVSLKWTEIVQRPEGMMIEKRVQKTQRMLYQPLNKHVQQYLPEKASGTMGQVFNLPDSTATNRIIAEWVKSAGIDKNVTMHVARHSFATLSQYAGVDLFVTSQLLGHVRIQTTEIYTDIIDQQKFKAIEQVDQLFANRLNDPPLWQRK